MGGNVVIHVGRSIYGVVVINGSLFYGNSKIICTT